MENTAEQNNKEILGKLRRARDIVEGFPDIEVYASENLKQFNVGLTELHKILDGLIYNME